MVSLIDLLQPFLQNVRIDLSCRDITVTQHQLNRAQVSSTFEQVRGERVPQQVRRQGD